MRQGFTVVMRVSSTGVWMISKARRLMSSFSTMSQVSNGLVFACSRKRLQAVSKDAGFMELFVYF